MPAILSEVLAIARDTRCNIFIESGTFQGTSWRRAIHSGIFEHCYSVEIVPKLFDNLLKQYPNQQKHKLFLGRSHVVFARDIFPLCTSSDRIFFWLDAHFSAGITGGFESPCPLVDELQMICKSCPTREIVIAIDDIDDLGVIDPTVVGNNWPDRTLVENVVYKINPQFYCLDYTGKEPKRSKLARGVLVYSYRRPSRLYKAGYHSLSLRFRQNVVRQLARVYRFAK